MLKSTSGKSQRAWENHRITKIGKALDDPQAQPSPPHCTHCSRPSVPHLCYTGTSPGWWPHHSLAACANKDGMAAIWRLLMKKQEALSENGATLREEEETSPNSKAKARSTLSGPEDMWSGPTGDVQWEGSEQVAQRGNREQDRAGRHPEVTLQN